MNLPMKGIACPFQRDGQRDFATAAGRGLLLGKVRQVLLTWGPSHLGPGEMPWRTEFGASLQLLPQALWDDTAAEIARTYIVQALAAWLPEVQVRDIHCRSAEGGIALEVNIAQEQQSIGAVTLLLEGHHAAR